MSVSGSTAEVRNVMELTEKPGILSSGHNPSSDANELLDFAIKSGIPVPEDDAAIIRASSGPDGPGPKFDQAFTRLSALVAPVTAETLRATTRIGGRPSEAERWSRVLWVITGVFLLLILASGAVISFQSALAPIDTTPDSVVFDSNGNWGGFQKLVEFCLPFLFGALGACAYLLRTCHVFIWKRTFDPRRKPEYISRILLGLVSGGAGGTLFARYVVSDGDMAKGLSAAAIGFLCGYNTDFLFTAIERLAAALLPKVPPPDTKPPEPKPPEPPPHK